MKQFSVIFSFLVLIMIPFSPGQASEPPLPAPLQTLVDEGSQIRYLGRHGGLAGWMTIRGGQEQYFYVTPDRQAMVMGILFDKDGRMITVRQVREIQKQGGDIIKMLQNPDFDEIQPTMPASQTSQFKTPAEQLYDDVNHSNWIALGNPEAPAIYTFMDPACPHCHAFTDDLMERYIETGRLQVRIIPVGLRRETRAQAAFLLAAPNPAERWIRHVSGDERALPVTQGLNEQGVERNLAIMQSWRLDVTPLSIYKSAGGDVRILQGRPRSPEDIINDLTRAR